MKLKNVILLVIVLILVGWLGTNLLRDQALFSNPFAEKTWSQKARDDMKKAGDEVKGLFK